jgi:hypothetical protein
MNRKNIKALISTPRFKLTACLLGIAIAIAAAAAMPPLATKSVTAGGFRPATVRTYGTGAGFADQAGYSTVPTPTNTQAGTAGQPAGQAVAPPSTINTGYQCPMADNSRLVGDTRDCGPYCTDHSYHCDCRGADIMCVSPE